MWLLRRRLGDATHGLRAVKAQLSQCAKKKDVSFKPYDYVHLYFEKNGPPLS